MGKVESSGTPSNNSISDIIIVGDTVWLGTDNGVSLSTDKGVAWTNFDSNPAFGGQSVSAIGYNQGVFWAATATSEISNGSSVSVGTGLKYTTDFGKTWILIPQPLDKQSDSIVTYGNNKLRALPVTVPEQNLIYDIAFTPGTIWVASFAGGLRKSVDMGKTWQRVVLPPDFLDAIKPSDTLDFCMQPVSGKFCSQNNLNYRVFSVISINDSTLYVGTADGINKSTNNGISWTKFTHTNENNPISGNFVTALGYNPYDSAVWGATWQAEGSTEFYGVSFSSDGGNNWKTSLSGEKVHNFAFGDSGQAIACSDDGAFRTKDNAINWVLPNSIVDAATHISLMTTSVYSAAFQGNSVWIGSADGLAKIDENGSAMWSGAWKVFYASQPVASQSQSYAFPNPFNPRTDVLKIKYSTGGQSVPVTIRIFNFSMNYIRTVIENAQRGNPSHLVDNSNGVIDYWDGKDANGNIVPNGVYFYRVDAGSNAPVYGKILVVQ
ncbi:MAG: WD40/YVTN/BNR-like repeat-containing protein [Ignavibacteriaceae bacterium]